MCAARQPFDRDRGRRAREGGRAGGRPARWRERGAVWGAQAARRFAPMRCARGGAGSDGFLCGGMVGRCRTGVEVAQRHVSRYRRAMKHPIFFAGLAQFLFLCAWADDDSNFHATVIHVHDGDTLTVARDDGKHVTIRLACVDAPELSQPGGTEARRYLERGTLALIVTVRAGTPDRYGRLAAHIWRGQTHINLDLVKQGEAWVYRDYLHALDAKTRDSFFDAERNATKTKRGLWAAPNPVPPWLWRRGVRY